MDENNLRSIQSKNVSNVYSTLKTIEINLINNCNRVCSFCPHGDSDYQPKHGRAKEELFYELYRQLLEKNFKNRISFCGFGEPTLHTKLLSFAKILKPLDCTIELVTNGDLLNESYIKECYDSGITNISVSIYEQENVKYFSEIFQNIDPKKYLLRKRFESIDLVNRIEIFKNQEINTINRACYLPSYKMLLDYNGNVSLCCNDWSREHIYGNIFKDNIYDIWIKNLNEKRMELITGVRTGVCSKCNVNGIRYGADSVDFFIKNSKKTLTD